MSTRCQILVEGASASVYRHSDGYPDGPHGVIKALKKIVKNFMKHRGFDPEYMTAHIVSGMIAANKRNLSSMQRKNPGNVKNYEQLKCTGFGIRGYNGDSDVNFEGDIEYVYFIKENRTIEVRTPFGGSSSGFSLKNTSVSKIVKF